jgi:lysine biosynthesis protein LysW
MKSMAKARATCPNCGEKTSVGERPKNGQILVCKYCGIDLEVVNLDPLILDWPYYPDDTWMELDKAYQRGNGNYRLM